MNVLVTGQKGYIGSVLTDMGTRVGHTITGLDTDYYYDCDFTSVGRDERRRDSAHRPRRHRRAAGLVA